MSNFSFTKLFSSITESTIWAESDHVRIAWITMLAMCDRQGRVYATIPGLAGRARISVEQCEEALTRFLSEDKYSRSKEFGGRRIEEIDGGWMLLNYERYRSLRDSEADKEKKRKWAAKHRAYEKRRLSTSTVDPSRSEVEPGRPKAEDRRQKAEGIGDSPSENEDASHLLVAPGDVSTSAKPKGAVALYSSLWEQRYGEKPHLAQKDIIIANTALREFSPEDRGAIITAFVSDDDKWLCERAHRLGLLPGQIDRLRTRMRDLEVSDERKLGNGGLSKEYLAKEEAERKAWLKEVKEAKNA